MQWVVPGNLKNYDVFQKSKNTALLNGDKANTIYMKMILFIFTFQNLKATLLSNVLLKQLI